MAEDRITAYREAYAKLKAHPQGPFTEGQPAIFSPAAAAQDEHNGRSAVKRFGPQFLVNEFTNWVEEASAHVVSAYLGDWSPLAKVVVSGPDALAFLSRLGMNDLSAFEIGQIKHHVQLDEHGWVASEGILLRRGEQEFQYTAGSAEWLLWQLRSGEWDATALDISPDRFIFGVQGPQSIHVLEQVLGESIRDIRFNRSRAAELGGIPVELLRTGISGELGYEIHGPSDRAAEVWRTVRDAGAGFGLKELGLRAQSVQHIESGIATNGLDFMPASILSPGAPWQFKNGGIEGSFVASAFTDYFRRPAELGWDVRGDFGHDFIGRAALLAERDAGGSRRVFAGLVWNSEDVAGVLTAALDADGEIPEPMELPRLQGPTFDTVLVDGEPVGVSSGRALSPTLRTTISLVTIDRAHAAAGTEVRVLWGRPGSPQREIRAVVAAPPFKPDHRRVDVATL